MASITPFAAQVCRCRQAAADTYTLVRTAAQSSANAAQSTAVTVATAERLDWIGNAATMFRQRLRELNARAGLFADRAQSTPARVFGRCAMNWQVTSTISGGHAHSAATTGGVLGLHRRIERRRATVEHPGRHVEHHDDAGRRTAHERARCVRHCSRGTSRPRGHVTLPFQRIVDDCGDHIRQCRLFADELTEMAELLIRAYSLYSEAERTTQRVVTELIQVGAALFPGHAAAATAASRSAGSSAGHWRREGRTASMRSMPRPGPRRD